MEIYKKHDWGCGSTRNLRNFNDEIKILAQQKLVENSVTRQQSSSNIYICIYIENLNSSILSKLLF